MTNPSKLEQVARAIWNASRVEDIRASDWEEVVKGDPNDKRTYHALSLAVARAAIAAMELPTEARLYTDRELLEIFRMLLRQQIREERIKNITELEGLLVHVEAALEEPHP